MERRAPTLSGMILGIAILMVAVILLLRSPATMTGKVITRANIVQANTSICTIPIDDAGWNLISTPCASFGGFSPSSFLSTFGGKYLSLHAYLASDSADPWKAYNPDLPSWVVQDLSSANDQRGYWINANDTGVINISDTVLSPRSIPLVTGWNLIGYPTHTPRAVNASLSTIYPYWTEIRYYNATSQTYYVFYNATQSGDFWNLTHYHGYWVYLTGSQTLVVSW